MNNYKSQSKTPGLFLSCIPILFLLTFIITVICIDGAASVQNYSPLILLCSAGVATALSMTFTKSSVRDLIDGIKKSSSQILSAIPILIFIGTLAATWMLSGIVPTLIVYGLEVLNPTFFLLITCSVCALVSVMTGSSWTTVATIGLAFMSIGTVMGFSEAWVAGAIISGAYFGDKISPLSDTTVLASSSSGVKLFTHIRYLAFTTVPAMTISLIVYLCVGFTTETLSVSHSLSIDSGLREIFHITPYLLLIPAITAIMICYRINTTVTLAVSSLLGLAGIFIFQPQIVASLGGDGGVLNMIGMSAKVLFTSTSISTGNPEIDSLIATGGVEGMLPTIYLVVSAMFLGGVLIGSGMLASLTSAITSRLRSSRNMVTATVGTGLVLNSCTGDQYLSIIIGGNIYKDAYTRAGLEPRLLSRSLEDSISVTSPLIPWNSCGITQSTVLGVATLVYLPCCIFNLLSPLMSVLVAWTGWRIRKPALVGAASTSPDKGQLYVG